jgi:elongator complex protein 4
MTFLKVDTTEPGKSPYTLALTRLASILASSPGNSVHRLVIPSLLSPALYPPHASSPEHVLQFLHSLRALLSKYSSRLTAMLTLPLSLYPRSSGLVRWMELLSDGVVELSPFPHSYRPDAPSTTSGTATSQDEPPQGLLKFHRLPILHDRGVGTTAVGEDWAFTLSRRKFTIKPFSLPPVEGDTEAQQTTGPEQRGKKVELDF